MKIFHNKKIREILNLPAFLKVGLIEKSVEIKYREIPSIEENENGESQSMHLQIAEVKDEENRSSVVIFGI